MLRVLLLFGFLLAACDSTGLQSNSADMMSTMNDDLDVLLLDEYRAEAIYARVISDFGEVRPFTNIILAEQRHSASLEHVYGNYGFDVPDNPYIGNAPDGFPSIVAACEGGVQAEITNASLYDVVLDRTLPADIRQVVQSNRDASIDRHLPAFQRCASGGNQG